MSEIPLGRFAWYELLTSDPDAAPSFYRPLTGWTTETAEIGGGPYTLWLNGETPAGGMMQLPEEAVAGGAPPHWLVHISTPNLDETVAKATELGATILTSMTIPTVGSFAIIADPQGAVFSAYQPEGDTPGHDDLAGMGEFSWNELMTSDWEAAWAFYSELFGWKESHAMDMGEMGMYQMFNRGAHDLGGMFNKPPEVPWSSWIFYVKVEDAAAAVTSIKAMGGTVMNGPMEVPGGDIVAQCMDPQGAAFAVHSVAAGEASGGD